MKLTTSKKIIITAAAGLLLGVTAACGGGSDGASAEGTSELTLGLVVDKTFEHGVVPKIIKEVGCFEDEGLVVDLVAFQGGADLVKGILSDAVDVGAATGFDPPSAVAKGVPMKAFYGVAELSPFVVITGADSDIEDYSDLVGKDVGITRFGSATDFVVRVLADKAGSPEGITPVPLGGAAEQTAALQRGDVDAFVWSTEVGLALEASGDGKIVTRFADVMESDQYGVLMAKPDFLETKADVAEAVVAAYTCGIEWMQDEGNREEGVSMTAEFLEVEESVADATYEELVGHLNPEGTMNTEGLENLAAALPDLGLADSVPDLEEFYTDEFVSNGG
jgi:ABC-type nitrate/sulfonate/bicarbonate transport system substrate-binding protein